MGCGTEGLGEAEPLGDPWGGSAPAVVTLPLDSLTQVPPGEQSSSEVREQWEVSTRADTNPEPQTTSSEPSVSIRPGDKGQEGNQGTLEPLEKIQ